MDNIIANMLKNSARKAMLENLDTINDIKFYKKELKDHLMKEFALQDCLEEKEVKEEAFRLWLLGRFNKTQNTVYLDILMKYNKIFDKEFKG